MTDSPANPGNPGAGDEASGFSPAEIRSVISGLLLAIFLGAIDSTIVAVALLTISRELGGISLLSWVVSAYLVSSTVVAPIYGKLSDLYGRKRLLSVAIVITLIGSVLCALAQSMPQLVVFRVVQGMGGGGLLALSQAIVADVAPGRQRGRYQAYFSGVFAMAAVVGPLLGGYLTHYLSWRAVFWVNLPIAVAALLLSRKPLARLPVGGKRHEIDYAGAALLTAGLSTLMIALTRIGQGVDWSEPSTVGLVAAAILLLVICGWHERRAAEPILPPALMTNHTVVMCCAMLALSFFVLVGCSVLLPLAIQAIENVTPDQAAQRMVPMTIGTPLGAYLSGRLVMHQASFKRIIMAGAAITAAATIAIAYLPITAHVPLAFVMFALGFGLGLPMPAALVAAQMSVRPHLMGIATATTAFFRTLGGAIGIAVLTSVLLARVRTYSVPGVTLQGILSGPTTDPQRLANAFRGVFLLAAIAALLVVALASRLKPTTPDANDDGTDRRPPPGAGAGALDH